MTKQILQIKIFISSPSDVSAERAAAQKVIDELNKTLCVNSGLTLFPLTWEENTFPSVGVDPQDVINSQIEDYDIFVGIMANRFGTPTNRAGSGTEEEFNIAFNDREHKHIMFFFKDEPTKPSSLDLEQYQKVKEFKTRIWNKGVYSMDFTDDFEELLRKKLTLFLSDKYINKKEIQPKEKKHEKNRGNLDLDKIFLSQNSTYEKYCIISALAVPNSQYQIKDIYVAQTLVKENRFDDVKETTLIDELPVELIKKYKKILITDTAGMGKSTIMKFMFVDLIDNDIKDVGKPVYIELNRLNKNFNILQAIQKEYKLPKELHGDSLLRIIQKGGFVFFLDGYDEISLTDRIEVTQDIKTFISEAGGGNFFILTSRPEDNLVSFGDFQSFKIQPLTKNEAYELLGKYDGSKGKEVSKKLISLLISGDYDSIDEYLENPLLVSLLYLAFNHKNIIPLKKHQFYRQVYEAFYDALDISKGIEPRQKKSGLDIDDFSRVLKCVGYICLEKTGVKFDKDTILKAIRNAKVFCANLSFKENLFLDDMLHSVPLFCRDGNEYRWAHKSLMEYFAARFIAEDAKEKQDEILTNIFNSDSIEKYINFLDLYYDIDNLGFVKNIERPLLEDYLKFFKNNYFESSKIKKEQIEERIGLLYSTSVIVDDINIKKYSEPLGLEDFEKYNEAVFNKFSLKNNGAIVYDDKLYFAYHNFPKRIILFLIEKRKRELFKPTTSNGFYGGLKIHYNLEMLDCHSGEKKSGNYEVINSLLSDVNRHSYRYLFNLRHNFYQPCFLSKERCVDEIEMINNMFKTKNEGQLSLLEGV